MDTEDDGPRRGETREEREERLQREGIREDRRRERERERRLDAKDVAAGKKSKLTRDRDRDVSEKVALGMANVGGGGEAMYDQRLFNQEQGMESGFAADDAYNVYDKGLFARERPSLSGLVGSVKGAAGGGRDKPVEFEKDAVEADPFGLDQFLTEVKKGKKAMDKIGSSGIMRAL
eukprot:SM000168S02615  [mRNA]  locus=s168:225750:226277:+ [translate_table: standard]